MLSMLILAACGSSGGDEKADSTTQADVPAQQEDVPAQQEESVTADDTVGGGDAAATVPGGWTYTEEGWFALTPAAGKKALYRVSTCGQGADWLDFEATVDAEADYKGTPCMKIALNQVGGKASILAYIDVSKPWTVKCHAIEVWGDGDADNPGMAYVFEPPFELSMDPTQDHQVSQGKGKMMFGTTDGGVQEITVDSTMESTDATIDVPFGSVTGATHFKVTMKECPETGECPTTGFDADGWFHPEHLVVKLLVVPGYCEVELVESWK